MYIKDSFDFDSVVSYQRRLLRNYQKPSGFKFDLKDGLLLVETATGRNQALLNLGKCALRGNSFS